MPANPGVDQGCACGLYGFCQLHRLLERAAILNQVEHRQAVDNNKITAHALTNGAHHFGGKTHPSSVIASPLILALVGTGREKLVNQIPLRPHDLHPIVARLAGKQGAAGKILDQGKDLIMGQSMRGKAVNGGSNSRGCHQLRLIAIAPGMQDLQGDFTALLVYRLGD